MIRNRSDSKPWPAVKMLTTIMVSSYFPANFDKSPIPKASPPANKVPNPLLSPLLRVAPAGVHCDQLLLITETLMLILCWPNGKLETWILQMNGLLQPMVYDQNIGFNKRWSTWTQLN